MFLYAIEKWQESNCGKVCELPNVDNDTLKDISRVFFYDEKYVYMEETLFREIVSIITDMIPINALKMALRDSGLLVTEQKSKQYVTKMNYYKENGKPERKRMMRFLRSNLSKPGNMDIIESMCI